MIQLGNGQIALGDCLDVMRSVPSASVDMILCDLPYGTTTIGWDSVIPFAPLWSEYWRITKPNAAVVLTASQPFTSALVMSQIDRFKYCWIWRKSRSSGFAQARNMPMKNYEDICVFSQGVTVHASQSKNRMPYNPQGLTVFEEAKTFANGRARRRTSGNSAFGSRPSHGETYQQKEGDFPKQVIDFPSVSGTIHPTQKPVALFEYLIRTYTNEGDTVMDNCIGSGTTAIAAENTGRRWIGIERDPTYFGLACDRIAAHINRLPVVS